MKKLENDLTFLTTIVNRLKQAGIHILIFGGWAEEMGGAIASREHRDVDLLYVGTDFFLVDQFIKDNADLQELAEKHFPHKRAFFCNGVLIEITLVEQRGNLFVTNFWNTYEFVWPELVLGNLELPAVTPAVVDYYRRHYIEIANARYWA